MRGRHRGVGCASSGLRTPRGHPIDANQIRLCEGLVSRVGPWHVCPTRHPGILADQERVDERAGVLQGRLGRRAPRTLKIVRRYLVCFVPRRACSLARVQYRHRRRRCTRCPRSSKARSAALQSLWRCHGWARASRHGPHTGVEEGLIRFLDIELLWALGFARLLRLINVGHMYAFVLG